MKNTKKHLLALPISLLGIVAFLIVSQNTNNTFKNEVKELKGWLSPEVVNDYSRYYEIHTTNTLINGTKFFLVASDGYVSTTSLNANGNIIFADNSYVDPFIYQNKNFKGSSGQYLRRPSEDNFYQMTYTSTISGYTAFEINITNEYTSIYNNMNGTSTTRYFYYGSTSHIASLDKPGVTDSHPYIIKVDVHSVVSTWGDKYLIDGKCNENFLIAKEELLGMDEVIKYALYSDEALSSYKTKYELWASSLQIDPYNE